MTAPPVIAFDGVCVLCHGFVSFMMKRDKAARFRFASTASAAGQRLFAATGQDLSDPGSVILELDGQLFSKSDAVLRAVSLLGGAWRAAIMLRAIPRPLRDGAYRAVATRRYRMFGKLDACPLPPREWQDRFLP